jgi:tetratricopeptide (TPR) repeat protein
LIRLVYRASLNSPFCRLAYETISKNRLDVGPSMHGRHQLIDSPQCSPAEAAGIGRDFEARLEAITAYCEQIGAVPVLIIPPANEADFEPSRSTLPACVSQAERTLLEREFRTAREGKASDPLAAADLYRKILDRHPRFAEASFRLARLEEAAGNREAASAHYLDALENDGLPVRCPARLRAAYGRVAARHARCVLVDGRAELAAESPRRLLDDHVIQDTHHPTFRGQVALARAVLRELDRKNVVGLSSGASSPFDAADCARHFEMDAEKWATMCDRTSEHYRRVAGYRYDPAERLEKSRRYAEAARRIRRGVEPERAGIPGLETEEAARPRAPGSETDSGAVNERPGARRAPSSSGDSLDLPILEQDGRTAAQESHGSGEVISVGAFDHFPDEAPERSIHDAHGGADRHRGLGRDNEARADHGVNLLEVSSQSLLIGNVQDGHEPVSPKRDEPVFVVPFQEHVAGKKGNDRLDSPALRRAAFLSCLRQVIGDTRVAQLAGDCLLLARFGVQAPPD